MKINLSVEMDVDVKEGLLRKMIKLMEWFLIIMVIKKISEGRNLISFFCLIGVFKSWK